MDETESSAKQMNNKMRMNDWGAIWTPSMELTPLKGELGQGKI